MDITISEIESKLMLCESETDPGVKLKGAEIILRDSLQNRYPIGIAASYVLQGTAKWDMSEFPEAINLFDKASTLLVRQPKSRWHVLLNFGYGNIYRELGVFEKGLEYYLSALKTAREIKDNALTIKAEGNVGLLSLSRGNYKAAIAAFENALNLAKDDAHRQIRVTSYINLAAAYHYLGEPQNALDAAQHALKLAENRKDQIGAHGNLGVAYTGLGNFAEAQYHLEKSLDIAKEARLGGVDQCVCYIDLADYYIKIGDDQNAIRMLLEGLELAQNISFKSGIKECHEKLHSIYHGQGNWEIALSHHEQLRLVEKSMFNESSDARLRNLETLHSVDQLREMNERQKHEIETLNQMKNMLLSDLSHDLRNPLASITLSLAVLKAQTANMPDEYRQDFHKSYTDIDAQVKRMILLIKDVLDMARYDTQTGIDLQQTNLSEMIEDVRNGFYEQAKAKNITLNVKIEEMFYAFVDPSAIRRMLENLISNSIKYTPDNGQVEIEITKSAKQDTIIRIRDNGVGIPEDQLPKIFERFYRIPTHTQMAEGTGLGMAIVKNIVDIHKGKIDIRSAVHNGTQITITLPGA